MEEGNIQVIANAYKMVKEYIVYDSFQTIMVAIVFFLSFMKLWDEYQKNVSAGTGFDLGRYCGQIKVYLIVCVIASSCGTIFNVVEGVLTDLQNDLLVPLGGDSPITAWSSLDDVWNKLDNKSSLWAMLSDGIDPIIVYLMKFLASVISAIGVFIFKYVYTFFIMGRYMWLLLLELVAPVAIVLIINDSTRSYFYNWVKNMFTCYLLIPMFLLADKFSNEVGIALVKDMDSSDCLALLLAICAAVWVKVKMFSVVRAKSNQLF